VAIPEQRQGLTNSEKPRKGRADACKKNHQEKKSTSTEAIRKGTGRREENSLWEWMVEVKHGATVIRAEVGHRGSDGPRYIAGSSTSAGAPSLVSRYG
jgi:hypothetical protein